MIRTNPMYPVRRYFRPWLVLVTCLSAACSDRSASDGGPSAQAAPAAVSPATRVDPDAAPARPRIVAYGDSLTVGLGLLEQEAYPAQLQRKIDEAGYKFEVVNAGLSGDTSAGGVRRLDWAFEGDVKVLIVAAIIRKARERGAVVILAGMEAPPNFGQEYATAFRQAFRDVALSERVLFIPFLLNHVAGKSDLNQPDGIHPNQQGAAIVADTVWTALEPLLDQMSGTS